MSFRKYASANFFAGDFSESAEGALSDFEKIIPENSLFGGEDIL